MRSISYPKWETIVFFQNMKMEEDNVHSNILYSSIKFIYQIP